jgi:hypothetical protein
MLTTQNRRFMKKIILAMITCLLLIADLPGQGIVGGDFSVSTPLPTGLVFASLSIYREAGSQPDDVIVFWGDGITDTLTATSTADFGDVQKVDSYSSAHVFTADGFYEVRAIGGLLSPDITNIEDAGSKAFEISNSVRIKEGVPWGVAQFSGSRLEVELLADGAIKHDMDAMFSSFSIRDSISTALAPFSSEGYSLPSFTDTIACCFPFVWDRPISPGRYGFCFSMSTWYEGELIGRDERKMLITVDSSMIVSVMPPLMPLSILQIYPNPSTSTLYLKAKLPSPASALLTVQDAMGRELLRQPLPAGSGQHELDVSAWPAGVYFLRLRQGEAEVVERFVKE